MMEAIGAEYIENGIIKQTFEVADVNGSISIQTFYKDNGEWKPVKSTKIDLTKRLGNSTGAIQLKKNTVNLDKKLIELSKKSGINLQAHRAKVGIDIDFSGSMASLFKSGNVQRAISRLLPLALRFDDNGELDAWIFEDGYNRLESMNIDNFEKYVNNEILAKGYKFGSTRYAPVIRDNLNFYFSKPEEKRESKFLSKIFGSKEKDNKPSLTKDDLPVFIIFITDGENFDKMATDDIIRESSKENIFIQFVGIGQENFKYLQKLDSLDGRECDNTAFIKVDDFDSLSDDELYSKMLEQYVEWIKVKGIR